MLPLWRLERDKGRSLAKRGKELTRLLLTSGAVGHHQQPRARRVAGVLSDPLLASAALDRLIHRAAVVLIFGTQLSPGDSRRLTGRMGGNPHDGDIMPSHQEGYQVVTALAAWCTVAVMGRCGFAAKGGATSAATGHRAGDS